MSVPGRQHDVLVIGGGQAGLGRRVYLRRRGIDSAILDAQHTADVIIWATGFRPALHHLAPLKLQHEDGYPVADGTQDRHDPHLHLLGYGDWTRPAAATLIGVGPIARDIATQVKEIHARQ